MELFKNRPLAFGCAIFLLSLFVSYFLPTWFAVLLIVGSIGAYSVLIIKYKISGNKRVLKLLIRISATVVLLVICGTVALASFKRNEKIAAEYEGKEKEIFAVVDEEIYKSEFKGVYIIRFNENRTRAILNTDSGFLSLGDEIRLNAVCQPLSSDGLGYNQSDLYRDDGIFLGIQADEDTKIEIISKDNYRLKHYFMKLNSKLDKLVYDTLNDETAPLVSAMLLGNREGLSSATERDFARLGIIHVLSLSGMHLALIAAMLSAFLGALKINKRIKYVVMIIAVSFFVALTGFAESAIRSGLMVIIFYALYNFGMRGDSVSALFLAVTLICIPFPYFIFSISLMLSFFSMIACMSSSYFIRRMRGIHRIRLKVLRNAVYIIITSLFVMVFTLPIVFLYFSSMSIVSPVANVVIVPFLTLLLYLSPFVLVFAKIPYLNTAVAFLCEKLTRGIYFVTEGVAKVPNIAISFSNSAQLIAVIILTLGALLLLVLSNEHIRYAFYTLALGVGIFLVSTIVILVIRGERVAISSVQNKSNDIIAIESDNRVMVIECSSGSKSVSLSSYFYVSSLGYNEIENYLYADYSYKMLESVDSITDMIIVRNILLPKPQNETEESYYSRIEAIAGKKGVCVSEFDSEIYFEDAKIYAMKREDMGYKNAVAFRICANNSVCTYAPSSARAVPNYFIEDSIEISDVVIFGSYGYKYEKAYTYEAKTLDYVVFLGASQDYCNMMIDKWQIKEEGHRFIFKSAK